MAERQRLAGQVSMVPVHHVALLASQAGNTVVIDIVPVLLLGPDRLLLGLLLVMLLLHILVLWTVFCL